MPCGAMQQALYLWACTWACAAALAWSPEALGDLNEALYVRHCPSYCSCYFWKQGLRRADCTERRLLNVDLGLPRDTEVADLSGNRISVLDDGCFQEHGLVQLAELSLRNNAIRYIGLFAFSGMRRLSVLDLSFNHLQTLLPNTFAGNRALKVLLLSGNNFARLPSDRPLLAAPHLQVLDLSGCKLPHLGAAMFTELPGLASLNLSANHLNQLQANVFQRMSRLQVLDAEGNPLNCDFAVDAMLEELRARNVSVSQPCPALSGPSKHLARLLADVVPDVPREVHSSIAESTGAGAGAGDQGQVASGKSEKMQDMESLMGMQWGPIEEKDQYEIDEGYNSSDEETQDKNLHVTNGNCLPPFPNDNTGNPDFAKEIFDKIPSFWACLLGFQVGVFASALVLCTCRLSCWRELCKDHSRSRVRADRVMRSAAASATAPPIAIETSPRPGGYMPLVTGELSGPATPSLSRSHASCDGRPETPPPAYSELMAWTSGER